MLTYFMLKVFMLLDNGPIILYVYLL
jgi:hypothetical protein